VTAPKTQQPISLSAILSSNFEIKTKKEENRIKNLVLLSSAFWIEENADCATDTDCQNNCDRYDERGVVQQFLEPSNKM
jgi:hypothetical protein